MTAVGSAAGSVPAAPTDPRELALHLDICRLQAELEGLEARIHQVEAARAAGGSGYDPFVERAEELVERMVASLYVTGRADIAETAAATDAEAEALVADARRRAQAILDEARDELAAVLDRRADAVAAAGTGVLDLTDPGDHPDADLLAQPEPEPAPEAAVAPEPEVLVDAVVLPDVDTSEEPQPAEPAADVVEAPAPEASAPEAPVADTPMVEAPAPAAAVAGPEEHQLPEGTVSALEAIAPHLPPMAPPAGGVAASDRTDAAFEAWMAVAPSPAAGTHADGDAGSETDDEIVPAGVRPSWVRPVEAAIALLSVAVLVVLVLLLVG